MKFNIANNGKTIAETLIALINNIPIFSAFTSPIAENSAMNNAANTILGRIHLTDLYIGRFTIALERYLTLYNNLYIIAANVPIATPIRPNLRPKMKETYRLMEPSPIAPGFGSL